MVYVDIKNFEAWTLPVSFIRAVAFGVKKSNDVVESFQKKNEEEGKVTYHLAESIKAGH